MFFNSYLIKIDESKLKIPQNMTRYKDMGWYHEKIYIYIYSYFLSQKIKKKKFLLDINIYL
jgi:hypothetical protein